MKLFTCGACGQTLYFHNFRCLRCNHLLGFAPDRMSLLAVEPLATSSKMMGVPSPSGQEAQLDAYARDTATVLSGEAPRHGGATRLAEIVRSSSSFH